MKVMIIQPPAGDFNFDSACTSPYVSAPSSPQRFGTYFFSAPTSPARISSSSSFHHFGGEYPSATEENTEFAFNFSGQLDRPSLSADELFDGGIIKPLKPHSPKKKYKEKLSEAIQQTGGGQTEKHINTKNSSNSSVRHQSTRPISPLRVSDLLIERENNHQNPKQSCSSSSSPVLASSSVSSWYSKWNLKDLLFRSKSEGSATTSKDSLKKYMLLKRRESEDVKNSSFRSMDSVGSVSSLRRKSINGSVSAHELHYTVNRAVSEEMRKKTFLPYKQGLLGCLGFSPAVNFGS